MKYDIYINSTIGWPFSAEYVKEELDKCKNKPCNVYISSLGGSAVDALQIRQLFIEHGDVTAHLHGFVASAATIIAMGAKKVCIGEFALFLMHRCSNLVDSWGIMNAEEIANTIKELQASKETLDTLDLTVANIYASRCGKKVAEVAEWMKEAKWLTSAECLARGLADEICSDSTPAKVTAGVKEQFLACGLPIPELKASPKAQDSNWHTLIEKLIGLLSGQPAAKAASRNPETEEPKEPQAATQGPALNTKYKHLMAALLVESLAGDQTSVTLTEEQATAIDKRLAEVAEENDRNLATIAELQQTVENLKKLDGDATHEVEDLSAGSACNHAARAREAYEQLKRLEI